MDPERQVKFKGTKRLVQKGVPAAAGFYMVEVSKNEQENRLYVAAFDVSSPESLLIKLEAE